MGQRQDHDDDKQLEGSQVKISSLIMDVINLVNKYKWKTYNILDKKHT